jgi:DNA polymerase III sliding clamp (beta) subunit (PCNA family)
MEAEGEILKNAIGAAQILLSECTLLFDAEGMSIGGIDETKAAMVKVKMAAAAFKEYDVKPPLAITLYMSELWKILKKVSSKSIVNMDYDDKLRVLKVKIKNGYESRYNLKTLETKTVQLPKLNIKMDWVGKLVSKHFSDAVKDIAGYTNEIKFTGEKERLVLYGMGDKVDVEKIFHKGGESTLSIEHNSSNPVISNYSAEYLTQMMDAAVSDIFIFGFGNTQPAYMNFTVPAKLKVEYWLAPRVK